MENLDNLHTICIGAGNMNRRDLFKFLAGIGLGVVAIETYERLYHIPMLEAMFRKELEYWITV
jgi:hypothetical protein